MFRCAVKKLFTQIPDSAESPPYTISLFRNSSQKYRSNKSLSYFAICLHANAAAL